MKNVRWMLSGAAVVGIALLVVMVHKAVKRLPLSQTIHATRVTLEQKVLASGVLALSDQVNIGAQVNGQIKALYVKAGDQVKKGDLLVEIDPVLQINALRKAQASLAGVDAQIRLKQQQINYDATQLKRQKEIFRLDGVSQADVDSAAIALETTRQELEVLKNQRQQALLEVDSAEANVSYTRITAPMDGTVLHIVARTGQTIVSAQASPVLMVLGDLDRLLVKAKISEADIPHVKTGQPVWFTISASGDKKFSGQLEAIEALPDSVTSQASMTAAEVKTGSEPVYYNGIFHVDNPEGILRPAMNAQVRIVTHSIRDALVIPVQALGKQLEPHHYQVQIRKGESELLQRSIRIGAVDGNLIQVLDGLSEDDRLVLPESI